MEKINFIQWLDLKSENRGGKNGLKDFEISVYKNLTPKISTNCGNYLCFSAFLSETYITDTKLKIGQINNKIVFQFNKEDGLNIATRTTSNKMKKNSSLKRVVSAQLTSMIHKSFNITPSKNSYRFSLIDIGNNTFMIEKII